MTKQNINVRNLQHVAGKLIYKGFYITAGDYCGGVVWLANDIIVDKSLVADSLEEILDNIDEISSM